MKTKVTPMSVPSALSDICKVGKYSYADGGSPNVVLSKVHAKLTIGSFVSIGPRCNIYLGSEHRTDFNSTFPFSYVFSTLPYLESLRTKGDVVIGSDVWIGGDVTILSGVTIGDGAVIGACSVVTKNVEPYEIVAGNPARHIRYRFDHEKIEQLLALAWWNKSDEEIKQLVPWLMSNSDVGDAHEKSSTATVIR